MNKPTAARPVDIDAYRASKRAPKRTNVLGSATRPEEHTMLTMALPDGVDPCTDLANAHRLQRLHGADLRYSETLGWNVWDGIRWPADDTREVHRRAHATMRVIAFEAADLLRMVPSAATVAEAEELQLQGEALIKHARKSQHEHAIGAAIGIAQSLDGIVCRADDFDADSLLLTVANGTIDLRTGELREARREDMITRASPVVYDAHAEAPTWLAFVDRIFAGDPELIAFMQRASGYSLTGETKEQCLFVCYGTGANGKTTFTEALSHVLGDFAIEAAGETFVDSKKGRSTDNKMADLRGARLVTTSETGDGNRLNESLVKRVTGGEKITANRLYAETFRFSPQFKLWLATNHKPQIVGDDLGIWRRLRLVPFTVTIPEAERDGDLPAKLRAEAPGILRWMVDGCREWMETGLRPPVSVTTATAEWRADSDLIAQFVDERCTVADYARAGTGPLYEAFREWCKAQGAGDPPSKKAMGLWMDNHGFPVSRGNTGRFRVGIGISDDRDGSN